MRRFTYLNTKVFLYISFFFYILPLFCNRNICVIHTHLFHTQILNEHTFRFGTHIYSLYKYLPPWESKRRPVTAAEVWRLCQTNQKLSSLHFYVSYAIRFFNQLHIFLTPNIFYPQWYFFTLLSSFTLSFLKFDSECNSASNLLFVSLSSSRSRLIIYSSECTTTKYLAVSWSKHPENYHLNIGHSVMVTKSFIYHTTRTAIIMIILDHWKIITLKSLISTPFKKQTRNDIIITVDFT